MGKLGARVVSRSDCRRHRLALFLQSLVVLTSACGDSLAGRREVRGDLIFGFEAQLFRPCGSEERWWFVLDPFENGGTIPGWDAAMQATLARCPDGGSTCGVSGVYLEGVAQVSENGAYGHLGQYQRTIEFSSVKRALSVPPVDCSVSSRPF